MLLWDVLRVQKQIVGMTNGAENGHDMGRRFTGNERRPSPDLPRPRLVHRA
jgi:hypothetical protein